MKREGLKNPEHAQEASSMLKKTIDAQKSVCAAQKLMKCAKKRVPCSKTQQMRKKHAPPTSKLEKRTSLTDSTLSALQVQCLMSGTAQ